MSRPATESAAWELRDRLRSMPQQPSAFVVPLAVMVFLRWADFQEAEAEAMAAFDETDHTPLLPASLHWRCWHDLPAGELARFFTEELPYAIRRLLGSNDPLAASLVRLLPSIRSLAELSHSGIATLAGWLTSQLFETPSDRRVLLDQFDAFLDQVNGRETGEFRTPACINALLAALAAPEPGEHFYDPCFGFAGNLIAACRRVNQSNQPGLTRNGSSGLRVSGMELNGNSYAVGLARLVLMGVTDARLEIGNSLERESNTSPRKHGYDCVIANPPWGQRIETPGLDHFPIQTTDSTALFLQHSLAQLRPKGRAVIVVPQGFLFQQGKPATLRRWLLENHQVEAVVSLPEGAFLPHTSIKAAILILRRDGGPTKKVRMVDGTAFFEPGKGRSKAASIQSGKIEELAAEVLAHHPDRGAWDVDGSMIAELGFDLSPTRREISEFERMIESLASEVPVHPLQQICELSAGRAIPSAKLSEKPIGENPIPYIRIGDIQRGQTTKSSSWLTPETVSDLAPRNRLRAGDVLISKSGTIGKVGVVRNGAVGGIASGGFFVLRPDNSRINPHFLAAYLQSADCQQWLKSKSSGSVISGLQKQFIETLPVPLPPLQIQQRVATDVREQQADAMTRLRLVLSQRDSDPTAAWLDRSLAIIPRRWDIAPVDDLKSLRTIFGESFDPLLKWADQADDPSPLTTWVLNLSNVADLLRNLRDEVRGSPLLNLLQQALRNLKFADEHLDRRSPLELRAHDFTSRCSEIVEKSIDGLLEQISVSIVPKADELAAGSAVEIAFEITNDSPLPLWNFLMRCDAWRIETAPTYLAENDIHLMNVEVTTPAATGNARMVMEWSATTMEGRLEQGAFEFAFNLIENQQASVQVDLGPSPYFISQPVGPDRNDVFFGREDLIAQIKRQLQSGNTVLLEGNRRAGKSSILKHLEGDNRIPGFLAIYSSFQGTSGNNQVSGMKSDAVWRSLAHSIASGVATLRIDTPLPDGSILKAGSDIGIAKASRMGISEDAPWEDFQDYLATILKLLRSMDRGMVLMIDEFDKLQEGIDNGVTSPQIPENIRYLIQTMPRFAAIMTGSRRMQRLRNEYWSALYGLGNRIGVTALDQKAAKMLVTEPVKGRLAYTDEAANLVVELTARQPYIIQYLCNTIFELANFKEQRSITASVVQEAARTFVEANEHFATLWGYVETDRRRFLISLIHLESRNPDPITFGLIKERLAGKGIELSDADLDHDLKFLQELELIDYLGAGSGGRYQLTIPLMREWLDSQQDHDALLAMALDKQQNSQ
jgi:type I restriction enzyme M protein